MGCSMLETCDTKIYHQAVTKQTQQPVTISIKLVTWSIRPNRGLLPPEDTPCALTQRMGDVVGLLRKWVTYSRSVKTQSFAILHPSLKNTTMNCWWITKYDNLWDANWHAESSRDKLGEQVEKIFRYRRLFASHASRLFSQPRMHAQWYPPTHLLGFSLENEILQPATMQYKLSCSFIHSNVYR